MKGRVFGRVLRRSIYFIVFAPDQTHAWRFFLANKDHAQRARSVHAFRSPDARGCTRSFVIRCLHDRWVTACFRVAVGVGRTDRPFFPRLVRNQ